MASVAGRPRDRRHARSRDVGGARADPNAGLARRGRRHPRARRHRRAERVVTVRSRRLAASCPSSCSATPSSTRCPRGPTAGSASASTPSVPLVEDSAGQALAAKAVMSQATGSPFWRDVVVVGLVFGGESPYFVADNVVFVRQDVLSAGRSGPRARHAALGLPRGRLRGVDRGVVGRRGRRGRHRVPGAADRRSSVRRRARVARRRRRPDRAARHGRRRKALPASHACGRDPRHGGRPERRRRTRRRPCATSPLRRRRSCTRR